MKDFASLLAVALLTAACGANVVFETEEGGGGSGAGGNPTTSSVPNGQASTTDSTSTGVRTCLDHLDCGTGFLCQFATGSCIPICDPDGQCDVGMYCDGCATSACPDCLDCRPGCLPGVVSCDDHDDCGITPGDDVCVFGQGFCAQRCGPASPPCKPGTFCEPCATSSCPACDDCIGACLGGIK